MGHVDFVAFSNLCFVEINFISVFTITNKCRIYPWYCNCSRLCFCSVFVCLSVCLCAV